MHKRESAREEYFYQVGRLEGLNYAKQLSPDKDFTPWTRPQEAVVRNAGDQL